MPSRSSAAIGAKIWLCPELENLDEAREAPDFVGGRTARRVQLAAQLLEQRAVDRLVLDALHQRGDDAQLLFALADAMRDVVRGVPEPQGEHALHHERGQQPVRRLARPHPANDKPRGDGRDNRQHDAWPSPAQLRRRGRPRQQIARAHRRVHVGSEHRKIFAKVEAWRELGNSLLPGANGRGSGRGQ